MERNKRPTMGFDVSNTSLGQELAKKRNGRPFREMARLCENEVDIATLSRLERDQIETPSRRTMAAISRGYEMPMEYLAQLAYCGTPNHDPEGSDDTAVNPLEDAPSAADSKGTWPTTPPGGRRAKALGVT